MIKTHIYIELYVREKRLAHMQAKVSLPFLIQKGQEFAFADDEPSGSHKIDDASYHAHKAIAVAYLEDQKSETEEELQAAIEFWRDRGFVVIGDRTNLPA